MARSAGENIDILIGGALIGSGEIVIIEEAVGVRITDFKEEDSHGDCAGRYRRCCWCSRCWARRCGRCAAAARLRLPGAMRPAGRGRSLESVERLALTPQHSLHLVRIGGREVVVATHPQGCALLTERSQ